MGEERLSAAAMSAIQTAETVSVSAISLYEIGQKARLGKWPEVRPYVASLPGIAVEQGARLLAVTPEISLHAATLHWDHRDPFDRLIYATAQAEQLVLISADAIFDSLSGSRGWLGRLW